MCFLGSKYANNAFALQSGQSPDCKAIVSSIRDEKDQFVVLEVIRYLGHVKKCNVMPRTPLGELTAKGGSRAVR